MLGSLDCYNWKWKNCPKAWAGVHKGHKGITVVCEAACSYDLWIWHLFFGLPGSLNDINVVERSTLMHDILNGTSPTIDYTINGNAYQLPYWLVDGIYPKWSPFVKTISDPQTPERAWFAKMQESARKDIERAFGVLQARFAIVRDPGRHWTKDRLKQIFTCCVILYNMIVEDERDSYSLLHNLDFDANDVSHISNPRRRYRTLIQRQELVAARSHNPV
jgi:Plant transposon protein